MSNLVVAAYFRSPKLLLKNDVPSSKGAAVFDCDEVPSSGTPCWPAACGEQEVMQSAARVVPSRTGAGRLRLRIDGAERPIGGQRWSVIRMNHTARLGGPSMFTPGLSDRDRACHAVHGVALFTHEKARVICE